MPPLSFRLKLLVAMMVFVGGVSGVTLFLTQKRVQAAYEKLFRDKLEALVTYVPKEQEMRIGQIKEECARLAKLPRIRAAMAAGEVERLYLIGRDELKIIVGDPVESGTGTPPAPTPSPAPGFIAEPLKQKLSSTNAPLPRPLAKAVGKKIGAKPAPGQRAPRIPYLGFLDAEGTVMEAPELEKVLAPERRNFLKQIARFGSVVRLIHEQEVGYLELGNGRVTEIIVTPVFNDGHLIGAVVYGIKFFDVVADAAERAIVEVSDIESGTWIEGKLYTRTIPDAVRDTLAGQLAAEIRANPEPRDNFMVAIRGVPHRVFYTPLNEGSPLPVAYRIGLYSLAGALQAQASLRSDFLRFAGVATLVALALSLLLSHGLSVPIRELVGATERISAGDFAIQLPERGKDDLGRLAKSFNEMAAELALKEKYHSILHTIADKDVAQQLLEGKIALGGELREATVMFCDIRGFTALTQNMDPAEVIALLNEHMTVLTKVVTEHHGVVDKFIGDSIMALFGAPKSYGDDALNAVRCAQRIMAERAKLNLTSRYHLQMGIGLATGQVLAGNMGSANRSNYTVLGERVNLAARLCSVAGRGEIVIGPTTREQLGDRITVEQMDPMQLKGFSDSVVAYKLIEVRTEPR